MTFLPVSPVFATRESNFGSLQVVIMVSHLFGSDASSATNTNFPRRKWETHNVTRKPKLLATSSYCIFSKQIHAAAKNKSRTLGFLRSCN